MHEVAQVVVDAVRLCPHVEVDGVELEQVESREGADERHGGERSGRLVLVAPPLTRKLASTLHCSAGELVRVSESKTSFPRSRRCSSSSHSSARLDRESLLPVDPNKVLHINEPRRTPVKRGRRLERGPCRRRS